MDVFSHFWLYVFNLHIPQYSSCNSLSKSWLAQVFNYYCTLVRTKTFRCVLLFLEEPYVLIRSKTIVLKCRRM